MPYQTIKRCGVVAIEIEIGSHDAGLDPQQAQQLMPKPVVAKDVNGASSLTCLIERRDNHMILKPHPPGYTGGKLWGKLSVDKTIQILKEVCYFFKSPEVESSTLYIPSLQLLFFSLTYCKQRQSSLHHFICMASKAA